MNRRLYFLFPDRSHTLAVVNELSQAGIREEHMHTLADPRVEISGLPASTKRQHNDIARRLETTLWDANLVLFGLALGVFTTLLITTGLNTWLLLPLAMMLATFLAGLRFTRLPNTHLDEFRDALAHGEILLMVDVPEKRVADIENRVHQHHPEATVGGVGWGTEAFGL